MIYPDLAFILEMLVRGDHLEQASRLLQDAPHPLGLSLVHRLQIENGLLRSMHGPDHERAVIAKDGLRLWRHYLDEEVFQIRDFDLEAALAQAAAWNAGCGGQPPRWGLLVHPAIAAIESATFMSFDLALRKCAVGAGLTLLPATL